MHDDLSAPSASPSKGFASILSLVSDVSQALAALEQADAAPPPPTPRPQPMRIAPEPASRVAARPQSVPAQQSAPARRSVPVRKPESSRTMKQWSFWLAIILLGTLAFITCAQP